MAVMGGAWGVCSSLGLSLNTFGRNSSVLVRTDPDSGRNTDNVHDVRGDSVDVHSPLTERDCQSAAESRRSQEESLCLHSE
jgi:hypothetical protein